MLRQVYSAEEVDRLMNVCNGGFTGRRNRTMICVLYRTGVRCGELLQLMPKDVDLELRRLAVRHAKGGKTRSVPLDDYSHKALHDYERDRKKLEVGPEAPLFCTTDGKPVWDTYMRTMLRRVGGWAAVPKPVHPHGFRHTFATELANEGYPLNQIRDLLGHESIATTNTYIAASTVKLSGRTWGNE